MRFFKRHTTDPCPQLVWATSISQDVATPYYDENRRRHDKHVSQAVPEALASSSARASTSGLQKGNSQGSLSNRKGISTWGKTVGRHLGQIKGSDNSDSLSVSSRKSRWSLQRVSVSNSVDTRTAVKGAADQPKPKKISRVESLRNLFKSDRHHSESPARNMTIHEEDDNCSHYPMEKAVSEGAIKKVSLRVFPEEHVIRRGAQLQEKKKKLSRSIQDLQEQHQVLDFLLNNQEALKTQKGTALAKETLGSKSGRSSSPPKRRCRSSDRSNSFFGCHLRNFGRNLFSHRPSSSKNERTDAPQQCANSGLEELIITLRLGCDESGYDTDSTRAGADSPDSGKSVPAMRKIRRFSITSEDYHGVDLSLPVHVPKRQELPEVNENPHDACLDDTIVLHKSLSNDSVRTDMTALGGDNEADTDSYDDDTLADFDMKFEDSDSEVADSFVDPWDSHLPKTSSSVAASFANFANSDLDGKKMSELDKRADTPINLSKGVKMQNMQKKSQTPKYRKQANTSSLYLLDNAASPSNDSPPAAKVNASRLAPTTLYYNPKKTRSSADIDTSRGRKKERKTVAASTSNRPPLPNLPSYIKTSSRRELDTVKLDITPSGSIGIVVEKCEAARPYYIISQIDPNGEAAKTKKFKIGDEIVRVCGRRLRGMTSYEARNALRNCTGIVELQIAREPMFIFGDEGVDSGADVLIRTRSDSEVWSLKKELQPEPSCSTADDVDMDKLDSATCEVVGVLTKDGKKLSVASERMDDEVFEQPAAKGDDDQKMTGMRKFQVVRKRAPTRTTCARRATSLSMNMLTITLEKGPSKKLGFTIVGGSNTTRGSMGIFVKDIMSGGQAAEEGGLRAGDEILAVNGISMTGLTHEEALHNFKNVKAGKIVLHVGRRDPSHKRYTFQSKSYDSLDKLAEAGDE